MTGGREAKTHSQPLLEPLRLWKKKSKERKKINWEALGGGLSLLSLFFFYWSFHPHHQHHHKQLPQWLHRSLSPSATNPHHAHSSSNTFPLGLSSKQLPTSVSRLFILSSTPINHQLTRLHTGTQGFQGVSGWRPFL